MPPQLCPLTWIIFRIIFLLLALLFLKLQNSNSVNTNLSKVHTLSASVRACMCVHACVLALTAPATHHSGWNAIGPFLDGGAGWSSVFQRAPFSPLLLQQVRQCPGDQQQSQRLHLLTDGAASSQTFKTQLKVGSSSEGMLADSLLHS